MIVITGAAGFIGSCIVSRLNKEGESNIIVVDVLRKNDKWKNLRNLNFYDYLDRSHLLDFLKSHSNIEAVIHMGACSATTETDTNYLMENNYRYTLNLAEHCVKNNIRFIYASSAATYGDGKMGYNDDEAELRKLQPMNMYGYSKHAFDLKAQREGWLDEIVGLKFFNVYGPNEYHKDDMASVVFKAFTQIKEHGYVKLFKSHRSDFKDGEQKRDFVYIMDAVDMVLFFLKNKNESGIYNIGTGKARTFKDLVSSTFMAMGLEPDIKYIDMPMEIRDRYQYFTEANMDKIQTAGNTNSLHSLEDGIKDYVQNYLMKNFAHY
ncbi:MAG: ADP-glyceromanno-heptose 6-epimerase [Calditrichaceae bacterium]|nr:ADP-glyceromanno-heptose 6-epimerase [Calditrichaceae bacterium]